MNYLKLILLPLFVSITSLVIYISEIFPELNRTAFLPTHILADLVIIFILFIATCHHFNAIKNYKSHLANIEACRKNITSYESTLTRTKELVGEICMTIYPEMEKSIIESLFPNNGTTGLKDFKQSYPELRSADLIKGYLAQINNILSNMQTSQNQISYFEKECDIILSDKWAWLSLPIDGNV